MRFPALRKNVTIYKQGRLMKDGVPVAAAPPATAAHSERRESAANIAIAARSKRRGSRWPSAGVPHVVNRFPYVPRHLSYVPMSRCTEVYIYSCPDHIGKLLHRFCWTLSATNSLTSVVPSMVDGIAGVFFHKNKAHVLDKNLSPENSHITHVVPSDIDGGTWWNKNFIDDIWLVNFGHHTQNVWDYFSSVAYVKLFMSCSVSTFW